MVHAQHKYSTYLRVFLALSGFLYVFWSWLIVAFGPGIYDEPIGRATVGAMLWGLAILSFKIEWINKHLEAITAVAIYCFCAHFYWLVFRSQGHGETWYLCSTNVVIAVLSCGFVRVKRLAVFIAMFVCMDLLYLVQLRPPLWDGAYLVATNLTGSFSVLVSLLLRQRAEEQIMLGETRNLRLQEEILRKDLEAAETLQSTILQSFAIPKGLSLNSYFRPSKYLSGDGFSYYFTDDEKFAIIWIGDVTGHGIASALITATVFGIMRNEFDNAQITAEGLKVSIGKFIEKANKVLVDLNCDKLMTMQVIGIDIATGRACCGNAGHNFASIVNQKGMQSIIASGNPLGLSLALNVVCTDFTLRPGDTLFMFTDGLIENTAVDGRRLRMADIRRTFSSCRGGAQMVRELVKILDAKKINEGGSDDITMLTVELAS